MKRKKWKAAVLAGLLAFSTIAFSACGSAEKKSGKAEKPAEAETKETAETAEMAAPAAAGAASGSPTGITVTLKAASSWQGSDGTNVQYDITVANAGSTEISDWSLAIDVPAGTVISQSWNMTAAVSGTTLSIAPADYMKTIAPGASAQGLGLIAVTNGTWSTYTISYTEGGAQKVARGNSGSAAVTDGNPSGGNSSASSGDSSGNSSASNGSGSSSSGSSNGSSGSGTSAGSTADNSNISSGERTCPYRYNDASAGGSGVTAASGLSPLSVSGSQLVNAQGQAVRLFGPSTHGLAWFPQYVNKAAFQTFRDDWGANCVRLAMYTAESGGYCTGGDQAALKNLIANGVAAATELGMYVIIDWHILSDGNPQTHQAEAIAFFDEMSKKYGGQGNVLYEICNEPNGGVTWSGNIKPYAEAVIPVIRQNAPNAVIIVGTPTWSQEVDKAAADPLNYSNIMYAFHFYAGTHKDDLRQRVDTAVAGGLPVFITECSITDASGNGSCDLASAEAWKALIAKDGLSVMEWSLSNKAESSAILKSSCSKTFGFTEADLNESGAWYRNMMRSFAGKQ